MRIALRRTNPVRRRVSVGASIPAPVKGLDLISPLANMDPAHAIALDNMFCQPGYIELRRDRVAYANLSLPTTPVESLMAYNGVATDALFAAAGTAIYNVTTGTASSSVTGLSNAKWQHINFATTGGNFLWTCNGVDSARYYDGSAWAAATTSGSVAAGSIIQVAAHKNRLWFVEVGTSDAHYLNVDSIQGTASAFPLGGLFTKGGFLQAIATWSRDGGAGPDDLICFASSRGQVAVYSGTNPAGGGDFAIVGVFDTSPPIGRRCFTKVGADLALVTIDGVLPLSRALATDRAANLRISLTQRIQPAIAAAAAVGSALHGWELTPYPRGTAAFLNMPRPGADAVQYVMNTVTGAWSRYTGWNAQCFTTFRDRLFFGGGNGIVYEADRGALGGDSSIDVLMRTAFNYFGSRGMQKHFKALRGIPGASGQVAPAFGLDVDMRDDVALAATANVAGTGALWDVALWDDAIWPSDSARRLNWLTTTALGHCASLRMAFTLTSGDTTGSLWDEMFWDDGYWDDRELTPITFQASAFDLIYERGNLM